MKYKHLFLSLAVVYNPFAGAAKPKKSFIAPEAQKAIEVLLDVCGNKSTNKKRNSKTSKVEKYVSAATGAYSLIQNQAISTEATNIFLNYLKILYRYIVKKFVILQLFFKQLKQVFPSLKQLLPN